VDLPDQVLVPLRDVEPVFECAAQESGVLLVLDVLADRLFGDVAYRIQ
jgi:hypothetical protein